MKQPLHAKVPPFIGDTNLNLSWKEATKPLASTTTTTIGFVQSLLNPQSFFFLFSRFRNLSNCLISICNLFYLYNNLQRKAAC